jgi:pimeloyl-ACP methyl ester carboxylesterase
VTIPEEWTTDTVHVNNVDLQYYRTGDGPPLVMAHGFYDNGQCWGQLATDLAAQFDVVTYDARAHGQSGAPATGYGIADRVADLVGLMDALDLTEPILLGHSMGATTVAQTAARHSHLPRAIVLEDPVGLLDVPDASPDERAAFVREQVREWSNTPVEELAAEYDDLDPGLAQTSSSSGPGLARSLAIARHECRPEIAEISREGFPPSAEAFSDVECPTLVLKADADPEARADDLAIADELADGRLVHVPGASHTVFRDEYDAAYAELRAFLHRV